MRIICCGNKDRGDDGVGLLVAEKLQKLGIEVKTHPGELLGLIAAWDGADQVIVVDAVVTGAPSGTVHLFDARQKIELSRAASTHGFGLAEAIELARVMHRLPQRLQVYGIEAKQFELGTDISSHVKDAADNVAREIAEKVKASGGGVCP